MAGGAVGIRAYIRGLMRGSQGMDDEGKIHATTGGERVVTQGLPPEAEPLREVQGVPRVAVHREPAGHDRRG